MRTFARAWALALLLAALWAQPAGARMLGLPQTMTTAHFQLHYTGTPPPSWKPVLHQQAATLAANLERAYTTVVSEWGFPAPLDDGDGKIDVYIGDLSTYGGVDGLAFRETPANQTHGYLYIDDDNTAIAELAMHELFHLVQFGMWAPMDPWLLEGTAEWAGFRFIGFPLTIDFGNGQTGPLSDTLGAPDMSLSCTGAACGLEDYERGGYSRWHFFQYLSERFGSSVVRDLFLKAKAVNDRGWTATDFLFATLADRGTNLGETFTDWTVANMTGRYAAPGLKGIAPVPSSTVSTGRESGPLAPQSVAVNHLAARYLGFQRGTSGAAGPCYAATLTINVALPFGVGSRPYFHWPTSTSDPVALPVSGGTASLSVPWDTCTWSQVGLLSLPNPHLAADAAVFGVTGTIAVDKNTLVTSTPPPAGTYTGPTVPAPTGAEPPSISVYGPESLRVSKRKRVLRVVVFSSGDGSLEAALGSVALGTRSLRAGNNDLRFTLPSSLGRLQASSGRLTFTSLSPGGARGASVSRKLVLTK